MSDELLKQILAEMVEIRKLLAGVQAEKQQNDRRAAHLAEMEMVKKLNLDPVEYLKERARRTHGDKRRAPQKTRKKNPAQKAAH